VIIAGVSVNICSSLWTGARRTTSTDNRIRTFQMPIFEHVSGDIISIYYNFVFHSLMERKVLAKRFHGLVVLGLAR